MIVSFTFLGSNNVPVAGAFYDKIFAVLGAKRVFDMGDKFIAWSDGAGGTAFSITKPYDGNPATVGNGVMIAIACKSPEQSEQLHALALSLGAKNEGDPGYRQPGAYCAYCRDLDGNKLNFSHMEMG